MDDIHQSEHSPVYHERDADTNRQELWTGRPPRLFVLVQEFDEHDAVVQEVVAYGIALPDGSAATISPQGWSSGRWRSPESASRRLCSDLLWLPSAS
jgi:hypothetical protein